MNEDKSPIAVPGFLDAQTYGSVYMAVETAINENLSNNKEPYSEPFIARGPFIAYLDGFDEDVYGAIQEQVEECFDVKISRPEIMFARLSLNPDTPENILPTINSMSRENEATFVVILDSTIPWKLYLDGLYAYTERNMGIFFPSKDGVNWSVPEEFSDLDHMDILLCRMSVRT